MSFHINVNKIFLFRHSKLCYKHAPNVGGGGIRGMNYTQSPAILLVGLGSSVLGVFVNSYLISFTNGSEAA